MTGGAVAVAVAVGLGTTVLQPAMRMTSRITKTLAYRIVALLAPELVA
jgi:hypothetical protein